MIDYLLTLGVTKETDNKLRWDVDVEGVRFSLYVPKVHVPSPPPQQLRVRIAAGDAGQRQRSDNAALNAVVTRVDDKTRTVRYRPTGDAEDWQIGEPYIPYGVLDAISPSQTPEKLTISVEWI